jgi:hypothetical protein
MAGNSKVPYRLRVKKAPRNTVASLHMDKPDFREGHWKNIPPVARWGLHGERSAMDFRFGEIPHADDESLASRGFERYTRRSAAL